MYSVNFMHWLRCLVSACACFLQCSNSYLEHSPLNLRISLYATTSHFTRRWNYGYRKIRVPLATSALAPVGALVIVGDGTSEFADTVANAGPPNG